MNGSAIRLVDASGNCAAGRRERWEANRLRLREGTSVGLLAA